MNGREQGTDPEADLEPDTEGNGTDGSADAPEPVEELDALQTEYRALNDRMLRLAAEFDNYRKRTERERAELWTRAQADLVGRLLDSLDDLQRYAAADPESTTAAALSEGAHLVEKKLRHALESAGLETVTAEGEFFNPTTMEALMTMPTERADEDELVASVLQKGYRFKDVLIRPARVQVKKHDG